MSDDKTVVADQNGETTTTTRLSRSSPVLLQYDGATPGKKFMLTTDTVIIGRRADRVHVWVDDASVSRQHCRLVFDGNRAIVQDLGSLNHTYINDKQVMQSAELVHGDMLRVGNVRLRYFSHGSAEQLLVDRIYRMAVQDKMLEIFRRDYLIEKLDEEFRFSLASGQPLSLIMFDLDKFKMINDTYGHDAGDFILKGVCTLTKPLLGAEDIFGRYGGEEFQVILPQRGLDDAAETAERVRAGVEEYNFEYEGIVIPVTISAGVATVIPGMQTYNELVKLADQHLYQSKSGGRNCVSRPLVP